MNLPRPKNDELMFLPLGILGQEYDIYRIKSVQNQDTSIMNIIEIEN